MATSGGGVNLGSDSFFYGARWIMMFNIAQRMITFVLNQSMIAFTTPDVLGMAAIQLELVLSTLLFLSREGIRLACLRESILTGKQRQMVVNVRELLRYNIDCVVMPQNVSYLLVDSYDCSFNHADIMDS